MGFDPDLFKNVVGGGGRTASAPAKPRKGGKPAGVHRNRAGEGDWPTSSARVLACDPSACDFGWAVLESTGNTPHRLASSVFKPSNAKGAADPFTQIVRHLCGMVDRLSVNAIVFEVHSGNSGYRMKGMSAATYGRAVEIPHVIAVMKGLPWRAVDVATWKGATGKKYTGGMVFRTLGFQPANHNEADALGLGWWAMTRFTNPKEWL